MTKEAIIKHAQEIRSEWAGVADVIDNMRLTRAERETLITAVQRSIFKTNEFISAVNESSNGRTQEPADQAENI